MRKIGRLRVTGWGPFSLPGEAKLVQRADEAVRAVLDEVDAIKARPEVAPASDHISEQQADEPEASGQGVQGVPTAWQEAMNIMRANVDLNREAIRVGIILPQQASETPRPTPAFLVDEELKAANERFAAASERLAAAANDRFTAAANDRLAAERLAVYLADRNRDVLLLAFGKDAIGVQPSGAKTADESDPRSEAGSEST